MNKEQLFSALANRATVTLRGVKGVVGGIEHEDGSGTSFNVKILTPEGEKIVYVKFGQPIVKHVGEIKVTTESGSTYYLRVDHTHAPWPPRYVATKDDWSGYYPVVAIYPERLPHFLAAVKIKQEGDRVAGFNGSGSRTFLLKPLQLVPGMILTNRHGLRSTRIVDIEY